MAYFLWPSVPHDLWRHPSPCQKGGDKMWPSLLWLREKISPIWTLKTPSRLLIIAKLIKWLVVFLLPYFPPPLFSRLIFNLFFLFSGWSRATCHVTSSFSSLPKRTSSRFANPPRRLVPSDEPLLRWKMSKKVAHVWCADLFVSPCLAKAKKQKKKSLAKSPVIWFRSSVHIERWSETQQLGECEQTGSSPYFGGVSHFGTFHGVEGFFGVRVFRPMFVLFSRVLAFRRGTGIFDTTNETVITVREDILKVLFVFWIFVLGLLCSEDYFYFLFLFFWVKAMQKINYFQEIKENR